MHFYFIILDCTDTSFFRDFVASHRAAADLPFVDVLKGMILPDAVRWPPATFEDAVRNEKWMTFTSEGAIKTLLKSDALAGFEKLLDVGGGDGEQ